MKRLIPILLCFLASCIYANAQETMRVETKTFHSPDFPFDREIFICTPQYYDEFDQSEVDVVYVFDSQWRSHFALTYAILAECQDPYENDVPFIVVGITSPTTPDYHRNNDFLPVPTNITYQSKYYGNYENFKKFIREDVMSYINSNYRTSGHTLAIGHSLEHHSFLTLLLQKSCSMIISHFLLISGRITINLPIIFLAMTLTIASQDSFFSRCLTNRRKQVGLRLGVRLGI